MMGEPKCIAEGYAYIDGVLKKMHQIGRKKNLKNFLDW